jgi:hypothetical protein
MKQMGLGTMIAQLAGADGNTAEALKGRMGEQIVALKLEGDDRLVIGIESGVITLRDEAQSCCEHRYMDTDDDLPYFIDARLLDIEVADGPDAEDEHGECHEQQFLKVTTDRGVFTVVSHNEHNGYYGGFCIEASFVEGPKPPEPEPIQEGAGPQRKGLADWGFKA